MIGKVAGVLEARGPDYALIDTGGVSYVVYCSDRTLAALPPLGARVALFTELVVREDLMQLFGFPTMAEKEWHRLLTSVQGIGAKGAMAILGTLGPDGVGRAITLGDAAAVKAAPGVGPKTAQRVILELKDKAAGIIAMGAQGAAPARAGDAPATVEVIDTAPAAPPPAASGSEDMAGARADALSALVNLGYAHGEAAQALAEAEGGGADDAPALIRAALRLLAPKG